MRNTSLYISLVYFWKGFEKKLDGERWMRKRRLPNCMLQSSSDSVAAARYDSPATSNSTATLLTPRQRLLQRLGLGQGSSRPVAVNVSPTPLAILTPIVELRTLNDQLPTAIVQSQPVAELPPQETLRSAANSASEDNFDATLLHID